VDLTAAYDSTDKTGLLKAIKEFHVCRNLRCLVGLTFKTEEHKDKTFNGISQSFETKKGLRHGYALACLLFNLALEKFIRGTSMDIRDVIVHNSLQIYSIC
jgi:sorting nexin-29